MRGSFEPWAMFVPFISSKLSETHASHCYPNRLRPKAKTHNQRDANYLSRPQFHRYAIPLHGEQRLRLHAESEPARWLRSTPSIAIAEQFNYHALRHHACVKKG